jgi:hypothetical protein
MRQRVAEVSRLIRIDPAFEQQAGHPHIVVVGGPHQWRSHARRGISGARLVRLWEIINLCAGVQQQAHRLHIAARGGRKDGADTRFVAFRGVGATLEQQLAGGQLRRVSGSLRLLPLLSSPTHEALGSFA